MPRPLPGGRFGHADDGNGSKALRLPRRLRSRTRPGALTLESPFQSSPLTCSASSGLRTLRGKSPGWLSGMPSSSTACR